jgi:hypothetical protein
MTDERLAHMERVLKEHDRLTLVEQVELVRQVRRLRDRIREHEHNARTHYDDDEHDAWDLDLWGLLVEDSDG